MTDVDVVIISYAKTPELEQVTRHGIDTLLASEDKIQFHIYVVETNKNVSYNGYNNVKTIHPTVPFCL